MVVVKDIKVWIEHGAMEVVLLAITALGGREVISLVDIY